VKIRDFLVSAIGLSLGLTLLGVTFGARPCILSNDLLVSAVGQYLCSEYMTNHDPLISEKDKVSVISDNS